MSHAVFESCPFDGFHKGRFVISYRFGLWHAVGPRKIEQHFQTVAISILVEFYYYFISSSLNYKVSVLFNDHIQTRGINRLY